MSSDFDHDAADDSGAVQPPVSIESDISATSDPATTTALHIKEVTQELLKFGYVEESRKPEMFRRALTLQQQVLSVLEPLDLTLGLDEHRGVAFLKVAESSCQGDEIDNPWKHPLVRRQRLTLEQSLLVAILRQAFMMHEQEFGVGQAPASISVDELLPQFLTYVEDSGSDARNESRLTVLLDNLKVYGIVSEINKHQEVTIRPLIAHLANPHSLEGLLKAFRDKAVPDSLKVPLNED